MHKYKYIKYNKMPHEDDIDAYGSEHNLDTLDAAKIIPREVCQKLSSIYFVLTTCPSYLVDRGRI